jgi:protein CpxP
MNHAYKHLIAAAVLATVGLAASAQPAPGTPAPGAHQGRGHFDPAKMQERVAKRQADLKQKLQITSAQEGAWASYTTATRPPANLKRVDRDALAKLGTPDRIDQMRALRNERIAEMDRRADATKAFYATLTPDQKKVFDTEAARHGHRHGHFKG